MLDTIGSHAVAVKICRSGKDVSYHSHGWLRPREDSASSTLIIKSDQHPQRGVVRNVESEVRKRR